MYVQKEERRRFLQLFGPKGRALDEFLRKSFADETSREYNFVNNVIVILIFLSIFMIILETVDPIKARFGKIFDVIEYAIVGVFTIEFLLNVYFSKLTRGKWWKYLLSPWAIIDLLAILPTYLKLANLSYLKAIRIFRILRFLRMLRVLKLTKHAADNMKKSRNRKFNTLKYDLQIYAFTLVSVVVIFGTLVFFAESRLDNSQFKDIPSSMWWCFVTITTVGYGDMYPVTLAGKLLAIPTMLSGLVLFGMLMNVVGKAMMDLLFGKKDDGVKEIPKARIVERDRVSLEQITFTTGDGKRITLEFEKSDSNDERIKSIIKSIIKEL